MRRFPIPDVPSPASVLCLGTGSYGSAYSEDESFALLDAFAERGVNFLDSAHIYAAWLPGGAGASERTVGRWLRSREVRSQTVIGTKGGHPELGTMHVSRLRPEDIAQDLAESLERLQTETIDLYWLHRDDPAIPVGEILTALDGHRAAGQIRAIGASNWDTARLDEAARYAATHGLVGFCASQIAWSLALSNTPYQPETGMVAMDEAALAYYSDSALRVIPYSAQAGGFFSRPYDPAEARSAAYHNPTNARRWVRAQTLARQRGVSANTVALAYLLNHPCGGAAIVGPHTLSQIEDSCRAAEIALSADDLRFLEAA